MLDQQVLQDAAQIDLTRIGFLLFPAAPVGIGICPAHCLGVLEVGDPDVQNLHVSGLVNVQLQRHQRPEGVVHPDPGDAVAVRDKIPQPVADDGGIGTVNTHSAEIRLEHLLYAGGVHQQQGQAVLPQVPPAPAAPAIVVVGQEGAAVDPPQEGLEADPPHEAVKIRIPGVIADVHFLLPVGFHSVQRLLYLLRRAIGIQNSVKLFLVLRHAQEDDV